MLRLLAGWLCTYLHLGISENFKGTYGGWSVALTWAHWTFTSDLSDRTPLATVTAHCD